MSRARRWSLPALLLALGACAVQAPPRVTTATLPRAFEGRYLWAESATASGYRVTLAIETATSARAGAPIAVHGTIDYQPGDNHMTIDGNVDPVTLQVRLRESAPSQPDAVTAGAFTGALSSDLRSLVAIWRSDTDGRLGALVLRTCGQ